MLPRWHVTCTDGQLVSKARRQQSPSGDWTCGQTEDSAVETAARLADGQLDVQQPQATLPNQVIHLARIPIGQSNREDISALS
jgi:hypothetical protein